MLGLTNNMEDIFTTNQEKAFMYTRIKLKQMDLLGNQVIEMVTRLVAGVFQLERAHQVVGQQKNRNN